MRVIRAAGLVVVPVVVTGLLAGMPSSHADAPTLVQVTSVLGCSGAPQGWTVPPHVDQVTVDVYGSQGGAANISGGGLGGQAHATLSVIAGQIFTGVVGCRGVSYGGDGGYGFGAGGKGGSGSSVGGAGGGGGSALEQDGTVLLVAGGGGGAVSAGGSHPGQGGYGGGAAGGPGDTAYSNTGGGGATQTEVGTPGSPGGQAGQGSDGGHGGNAYVNDPDVHAGVGGGGGGGGWLGGGGGGSYSINFEGLSGAGGGGSGYAAPGLDATLTAGVSTGAGSIVFTYLLPQLTVTASSARVLYGSGPVTVTPSYSGFVNGDDSSVVSGVTCLASVDASTPPGTYASTCSGGSAAGYALTYVAGTVTVAAPTGQGRIAPAPVSLLEGASGRTVTLTYTATRNTMGLLNGRLQVAAPAGWPAASTTPTAQGFSSSTCGTEKAIKTGVQIDGVTLPPGGTCTITYGDRSQGGPGVTIPLDPGTFSFAVLERSTAAGTVHPVAGNAGVNVGVRPLITGIDPHSGPASGGTSVTITGSGFTTGDTVLIGQGLGAQNGALTATNVQVVSATQITFTTPASSKVGPFHCFVIAPDGAPSLTSSADQYTYLKTTG